MNFLSLFFLLSFSANSQALVIFDANAFYLSDAFKTDTDASVGRTLWDLSLGMSLRKKGRLILGWNYASSSFTDTADSETITLTVSDMGPKLSYFFDKEFIWSLGFAYNLITKGNYDNNGDTKEFRGTSMKVDFGYTPHITENFSIGAKLNYYKPSFNEQISGETTLEAVSYGRTVIYPSMAFHYRW